MKDRGVAFLAAIAAGAILLLMGITGLGTMTDPADTHTPATTQRCTPAVPCQPDITCDFDNTCGRN